jgi:hypothetical protein
MAAPTENISSLLSLIRNTASTDSGAQEMEKRVQEAISALEPFTKSAEHLLSVRARAAQKGLEKDVVHYLKQYWLTDDKVNRMSKLAQARSQACLLLGPVLTATKK